MKRRQMVKWLMLIAVALVAVGVWADVYVPPPRTLWYVEWLMERQKHSVLLRIAIPCSVLVTAVVVLTAAIRRRRPSYLLWLACCAPLVFCFPNFHESPWWEFLVFPMLCVSAVTWIVSVALFFGARKYLRGVIALLGVPIVVFVVVFLLPIFISPKVYSRADRRPWPIAVKADETYQEYQKRANRIINHLCDRCDKPMKDYWRGYWLCPDCDKGEMTCQKCGARKKQEGKGPHRHDGFEWLCPNCDKDRLEEYRLDAKRFSTFSADDVNDARKLGLKEY